GRALRFTRRAVRSVQEGELRRRQVRRHVGCRRAGDFRRGRGPGAPQGGRPMIRINLLSVEKPIAATASSGPKFSLNLSAKAGPVAALFVLAGCAGGRNSTSSRVRS